MLASASKAIVLGFSIQPDSAARNLAEAEGVSIRTYDIIYRMLEDVEKALKGMLEPKEIEVVIGHADVRATFRVSKVGVIAGCRVTDGELRRNSKVRINRGAQMVYEGEVGSLRHLQEDVREVRQGHECGVSVKGFDAFNAGDVIECYVIEKSE